MLRFVALRYLVAHLRQTVVCVAGVAISVTMFLAMTSMMSGFTDKFIIETVESSGHLTVDDEPRETRTQILERAHADPNALLVLDGVKPRDEVQRIKNPGGLVAAVTRLPHVVAAAPLVVGDAVATYGTKTFPLQIYGCEPERLTRVTTIGTKLTHGSFDRLKKTGSGVVLGRGVALTLGAKLDDSVTLTSSAGGLTVARVVGIFDTGVTPVDYGRAYMLLAPAQTLLDKKNVVNQLVVRLDDYTLARGVAAQLERASGYKVEAWQEANENFLKIFAIQTIITYFITGALLVVAAFGVLNILVMAVLERVNDIAILKSFGLSRADVTKIYLLQGALIGVIGCAVGVACGKGAIEGLRRLPIQIEGLVRSEGLLMSEGWGMYVTAVVGALVATLAAAAYPARRAAGYDPVEVIRGAH